VLQYSPPWCQVLLLGNKIDLVPARHRDSDADSTDRPEDDDDEWIIHFSRTSLKDTVCDNTLSLHQSSDTTIMQLRYMNLRSDDATELSRASRLHHDAASALTGENLETGLDTVLKRALRKRRDALAAQPEEGGPSMIGSPLTVQTGAVPSDTMAGRFPKGLPISNGVPSGSGGVSSITPSTWHRFMLWIKRHFTRHHPPQGVKRTSNASPRSGVAASPLTDDGAAISEPKTPGARRFQPPPKAAPNFEDPAAPRGARRTCGCYGASSTLPVGAEPQAQT
jgi:hypothetical protein